MLFQNRTLTQGLDVRLNTFLVHPTKNNYNRAILGLEHHFFIGVKCSLLCLIASLAAMPMPVKKARLEIDLISRNGMTKTNDKD